MFLLILFRALIWADVSLAQQTVNNQDPANPITYTCPNRETIETAYYGYCPQTTNSNAGLNGITTVASYSGAPGTYQTQFGDLTLTCGYDNGVNCNYQAGGNQPLQIQSGQSTDCMMPNMNVPQPSPPANGYKKRYTNGGGGGGVGLKKRAPTARPQYNCPFDGTNGLYINTAEDDGGRYAIENAFGANLNVMVNQDEILYSCAVVGGSTDVDCFYLQDTNGGLTFVGSSVSSQSGYCPNTLCNAITTGSGNMKRNGAFIDSAHRVRSRQVDTKALREKLQDKRRKEKQEKRLKYRHQKGSITQ